MVSVRGSAPARQEDAQESLRDPRGDAARRPTTGLGKPEPLRHNLSGFWSRRISHKDRLIYKFDDTAIYVFAIGGHYDSI
jgi:toxin YoeB